MKLFVRAPMTEKSLIKLKKYFDEIIYQPWTENGLRYYEDEMIIALEQIQPDVLITELDKITNKVVNEYNRLILIGDCRAKPENIDISACTKAGLPVICTPGRNAQAVAEMMIGLIISFYRKIIESNQWLYSGNWIAGTTPYFLFMGNEIHAKKVGFIGMGAVGQAAAKILEAFDCDIFYYDPYIDLSTTTNYQSLDLTQIFEECDIISVHLPVNQETKGLINRSLLQKMKPEALFVNTARSDVVKQADLIEVLRQHQIGGAIIDVYPEEPPNINKSPLFQLDNVLLTPHICGASHEVYKHHSAIITNRMIEWLEQRNRLSLIYNKEILL